MARKRVSGLTKTDFMRGMQCPRMLWLDKHHPEYKIIPPHIRERLNMGNQFGDEAMGLLGPYVEVREYYPGTSRPNKKRMAEKTKELLEAGTPVICEAAFLDDAGNYCAVDLLRKVNDGYELYEVKNASEVAEQHIKDAAYQVYLIRDRLGLPVVKAFIIHNSGDMEEPFTVVDCTEEILTLVPWIAASMDAVTAAKYQPEEIICPMGEQCNDPYECWYIGYCSMARSGLLDKPRCAWANPANPLYIAYHDEEWGVPCHNDCILYERLILESFQAGLSWETILNKRENFRAAYDGFELDKVCAYDEEKVRSLLSDKGIVRSESKIRASIRNSRVFRDIQTEFSSFDSYIWSFTQGRVIYENDPAVTTSPLSDAISRDLRKRGMSFVGSTIIYSYLQAIGIINAHCEGCFKFVPEEGRPLQ